MSRIGRAPIAVPAGVEVKIEANNVVTVKGPKGTMTRQFHPNMKIEQEGEVIRVTRPNDAKENRSLHGLTRTLIHNMVVGVTEGYKKERDVTASVTVWPRRANKAGHEPGAFSPSGHHGGDRGASPSRSPGPPNKDRHSRL